MSAQRAEYENALEILARATKLMTPAMSNGILRVRSDYKYDLLVGGAALTDMSSAETAERLADAGVKSDVVRPAGRDIHAEIAERVFTGGDRSDVEAFIRDRVRSHPRQIAAILYDHFASSASSRQY